MIGEVGELGYERGRRKWKKCQAGSRKGADDGCLEMEAAQVDGTAARGRLGVYCFFSCARSLNCYCQSGLLLLAFVPVRLFVFVMRMLFFSLLFVICYAIGFMDFLFFTLYYDLLSLGMYCTVLKCYGYRLDVFVLASVRSSV